MRLLHEENEEMQARFQARFQTLSETSGNCRKEADNLEEEIQALQAGEERRGSCVSQSNGCCFNPATVQQQHRLIEKSAGFSVGNIRRCQQLQSMWQEEKRKKSGKEIGTSKMLQATGIKALQWILLWILFGVKMQTVRLCYSAGDMESDGQVG